MKALVIMPTYNELGNLGLAVEKLFTYNPEVELLVVDDSSPDGTGDLADSIAKNNPRVHVLHRAGKEGLGAAYIAGFLWAFERNFDFLVEMDADGSHRAEDLKILLGEAPNNELVIGSRYTRGGKTENWPLRRKILSRGGNIYARFMLGGRVNDLTAGYRVFRSSFLQTLDLNRIHAKGYSFQIEMAYRTIRSGARVAEVPITFVEREIGVSKMSSDIVREALILITKLGFRRLFGQG